MRVILLSPVAKVDLSLLFCQHRLPDMSVCLCVCAYVHVWQLPPTLEPTAACCSLSLHTVAMTNTSASVNLHTTPRGESNYGTRKLQTSFLPLFSQLFRQSELMDVYAPMLSAWAKRFESTGWSERCTVAANPGPPAHLEKGHDCQQTRLQVASGADVEALDPRLIKPSFIHREACSLQKWSDSPLESDPPPL